MPAHFGMRATEPRDRRLAVVGASACTAQSLHAQNPYVQVQEEDSGIRR